MDKKLIRNEYEKKVKLLNYYNRKYFNENLSEISDSKYDLLKKEMDFCRTQDRPHGIFKENGLNIKPFQHKDQNYFQKILILSALENNRIIPMKPMKLKLSKNGITCTNNFSGRINIFNSNQPFSTMMLCLHKASNSSK